MNVPDPTDAAIGEPDRDKSGTPNDVQLSDATIAEARAKLAYIESLAAVNTTVKGWLAVPASKSPAVQRPEPSAVGNRRSLQVNLKTLEATITGGKTKPKTYPLKSQQSARFLKILAEHPMEWISGPRLVDYDDELDGCRSDRLRAALPHQIQSLIATDKHLGMRLTLA